MAAIVTYLTQGSSDHPWVCRLARMGKVAVDLFLLVAAYGLAFVLRFEGALGVRDLEILIWTLPLVLLVKAGWLAALNISRMTWRHVGFFEARRLLLALVCASATLVALRLSLADTSSEALIHLGASIPLGVLLIDLVLSLLALVGVRACVRLRHEFTLGKQNHYSSRDPVPTLLIGAGQVGALVARELAANPGSGIQALGFLDANDGRSGIVIQGIPILGTPDQLPEIVRKYGARQALITLDNASGGEVRRVAQTCKDCGIAAKIIPGPLELMNGARLPLMRDVAIEDLLGRAPVRLDREAIAGIVKDRCVMITGAGGSIGSELCRLVSRLDPSVLLLVEQAENSLFFIHRELLESRPSLRIYPCVADICDRGRMDRLFARHQPQVVFHAAAHKHVPMMEANPGEAIKNNVLGTRTVADLAHDYGVLSFVMISTDKAVNPTSVMGASKRVADLYVPALSQRSDTRFVAVRFGNVLGSNGSVIPIFKEQIAQGGPVTVTHPEMKRYFMTIPEACQLVLQAASMGEGGEIFVLDMGQPIKILDLARDLIRLSGFGEEEIDIKFTGLRPGEKLFEELSLAEESTQKTRHPLIFIGRLIPYDWGEINDQVDDLGRLAECGAPPCILAKLKEIVAEFHYRPSQEPTFCERLQRPVKKTMICLDNQPDFPKEVEKVGRKMGLQAQRE